MHNNSAVEKSYDYHISSKQKVKKAIDNIMKILMDLVFIFLIGFLIITLFYNLYSKKYGQKGDVPLANAYVIVSPSMVPTINVLDAVISIKPNIQKLASGDIITFGSDDSRYNELTVTHRVLKAMGVGDKRSFITKGDNNTTPDSIPVKANNVLGKVVFVVPFLGYLQFFLTKYYGWILLVVLPCVGMIVYDILKISKAVKNTKANYNAKFKDVEIKNEEVVKENKDKKENKKDYHETYSNKFEEKEDDFEFSKSKHMKKHNKVKKYDEDDNEESDIELL